MRAFGEWLYGTAPSVAVHSTFWLIRLLQATHLLTAGVAAGSGAMIALRALGWVRADEPFAAVSRRFVPWLVASLAVMVVTGTRANVGRPGARVHVHVLLGEIDAVARVRARHALAVARRAARRRVPRVVRARRSWPQRCYRVLARDRHSRPHDRLRRRDLGQLVAAHMSTQAILASIESSALAEWMRVTLPAMQIVEAMHVLAAVMLFGTVLIVDLKLLGVQDARRSFARVGRETLPLTWTAFGVAVVTGCLMFTTSAQTYFGNAAFQWKTVALAAAGVNMLLFQLTAARSTAGWDGGQPPRAARFAGLASLLLWAAVVLLGRWIGFTKGYDFTIPPGMEFPG